MAGGGSGPLDLPPLASAAPTATCLLADSLHYGVVIDSGYLSVNSCIRYTVMQIREYVYVVIETDVIRNCAAGQIY